MNELILVVILLVLILIIFRGLILVFSEHFWLALLMLFVLPPLLVVWIIFRGITG
jgi:hypothetical protein